MAEKTRRSRRLQGRQPERDAIDLLCAVCLLSISANLYNCTMTRYCHQPIHRPCLENALRINARCPLCRTRQRVQTRRSRRLQRRQPERDAIDLLCGVCRLSISVNLYNCTITRYVINPFTDPVWKMHYESMDGAHYAVPGKECNIQIMLILPRS